MLPMLRSAEVTLALARCAVARVRMRVSTRICALPMVREVCGNEGRDSPTEPTVPRVYKPIRSDNELRHFSLHARR